MKPSTVRYPYLMLFCGICILLIALSVLIGWQLHIQPLKTWLSGITPMNPVTACFFLICGIWSLVIAKNPGNKIAKVLSIATMLFGFIHFITYFFPIPALRMDFLLYGNVIRTSGIPNLIAPNTALNFLLCGTAMLLVNSLGKQIQFFRQATLLLSFLLVYISLLGYLFNIQPAYRFGGLTPMALITSVAFLILVIELFFADTRYGIPNLYASDYNGGLLMRRAIPFVLIMPPLLEYIRFNSEKLGFFTGEFGVELSSFIFTIALLLFIGIYAGVINESQKKELDTVARYRTLMDSLHEVVEIDRQGRILYANPGFERMMGYPSAEIIGKEALELLVPQKDKQIFRQRLADRRAGKAEIYTAELIAKNGTKRFISIHANPLVAISRGVETTVVSFHDITDVKMHLQDLEAFTASAAHDLNSPLASIQMLLQSLDKSGLNEEQSTLIHYTVETAQRMTQLLQDLLQFYRWGEKELKKDLVDSGWIVREISDLYDTTGVRLNLQPLPVVFANEGALRQLFTNLISNAIKYSAKSESPQIEIGVFQKHNQDWFYISDNGIGIDETHLPQLFSPFKRFTSKFDGNGLGLAIVKRIIEKHGGSIIAKNNPDRGMRFEFTLAPER